MIIHTSIPLIFGIFATIYYIIIRKWASREPIEDDDDEDDEEEEESKKMD